MNGAARKQPPGAGGPWLRRVTGPVIATIAAIYFLIDAIFYSFIHPLATMVARLPIFAALGAWVRGLGPYPTLALFLIPVIVFEPVKPVALYLIGTGRFVPGALVLAIGETLKIVVVERLFHMSRDKLMMIPAFAWTYRLAVRWLDWLTSLPPWQAVLRRVRAIRAQARRLRLRLRILVARWRAG